MTDHSDDAATPTPGPDYPLADQLDLDDPAQYRALFEDTRQQLVSLLLERAATTSELAAALDRPKGTIGHHLKVLEAAGLVHVVRTQRVRALEAKYYGRTARVFMFNHLYEAVGQPQRILARAAAEVAALPPSNADDRTTFIAGNARYARIPLEQAGEWARRMDDLMVEFSKTPAAGETTYALVYGLYPSSRSALPDQSGGEA